LVINKSGDIITRIGKKLPEIKRASTGGDYKNSLNLQNVSDFINKTTSNFFNLGCIFLIKYIGKMIQMQVYQIIQKH